MLPPLRKKTPEERARARLPEGEDLTFSLFGERAIIGNEATGAMSEGTEWQLRNESPPEDDQTKALRELAQEIAVQTAALQRLADESEITDLERLLQETKALTYGKPDGPTTAEPTEDNADDSETYP